MTNEEAIRILDPETRRETMRQIPVFERIDADQEACRIAVSALRAQQKHTLEGCEMCRTKANWADGGAHDFRIDGDTLYYFDVQLGWEGIEINFCPFCGRPLTEEAWSALERRIGGNDEAD